MCNFFVLIPFLVFEISILTTAKKFDFINLPKSHLPFYFNKFPNVAAECRLDDECPYKKWVENNQIDSNVCWGYEPNCTLKNAFSVPSCPGDKPAWLRSKQDQIDLFYNQADFGYLRYQLNEMTILCTPLFPDDSALECSKYLRMCRGRNIFIDLREISTKPERYKTDVLKKGEIGGYCRLNQPMLDSQLEHMSALQSWGPELRNFVSLDERPIDEEHCDMIYERPTYIVKIDATNNMYHHFCDFFNLYASLHLNMTHPMAFARDNHIIIWETYEYDSPFSIAYKAFTQNAVINIRRLKGKRLCFKKLLMPLLPRMIFGLYYNTPIIHGCEKSGLIKAFSDFLLHRLRIPRYERKNQKIRITFLARRTKYRRVLNENELLNELRSNDSYAVKLVHFESPMTFEEQLAISRNSDIFIGMHGAGLTHLLFLPDWATIFELYNCEDPACYKDLARLRGVNYITWENRDKVIAEDEGHHPQGGAHAKFTNYRFDTDEFRRLVEKAATHVQNHPKFQKHISKITNGSHLEL